MHDALTPPPHAPSAAPALLQVAGLSKRYGSRLAVDRLSFELRAGEVLGLIGPNGAGKSTLVSCVLGLLRPDAGGVLLRGQPLERRARASVGVAPQELALYPDLSGEENLLFFARLHGLRGARLRQRVEFSLDFVGLSERRRERVETWSGGMQRRLNLALAIVHDPQLVILDEPTVGVDPHSRNRILENVEGLRAAGKGVIYSSHYMPEAERICDRILIVDRGRILAEGSPQELVARHGGPARTVAECGGEERVLVGEDPWSALAALRALGRVDSFRFEAPSLERAFLALTGRALRD